MKKVTKILGIVAMFMIATIITACGGDDASTEVQEEFTTYAEVYDVYSVKIQEAAPTIVDEFNAEAESLSGDLEALAGLCTEKTEKLAEISVEGTEKMAEIKLSGTDNGESYEDWAAKLNDVYMEEAQKIQEAYMKAAM